MKEIFKTSKLKDLIEQVEAGVRLSREDGIRLINSEDLLAVGYMADIVRLGKHGERTYFTVKDHEAFAGNFSEGGVHPESEANAAFLLYGRGESAEERIDQLLQIRDAQDQQRTLLAFAPIAFHAKSHGAEEVNLSRTTGFDDLKMLAISRVMLDNVEHIKAFWMLLGSKLAQVALSFGVDDVEGVVNQSLTKGNLVATIQAAGRIPVERDTSYNIIG